MRRSFDGLMALAETAVGQDPLSGHLFLFGRLYQLEELWADLPREERQHARALPVLAAFRTWLDNERPRVLPKSLIGAAFTYTLKQWRALCRYCEDGALSIDNNLAERTVKLPAIGRKNWLFVASEVYSFFSSLQRRHAVCL